MNSPRSNFILGILGSGQLARMSAMAAADLGFDTYIFCFDKEFSPAEHVATKTFKGNKNDLDAILTFCSLCDLITLENEFIDQSILEAIENKFPNKLFPSANTFKKIGDKISEKKCFEEFGLDVVPYKEVHSPTDVSAFAAINGLPVVLKSSKGGYDGYGNITIYSIDEIEEKFSKLNGPKLVEAYMPFEKELAVMVARNAKGETIVYPIAHTIQENHICHFVSIPAEIPKSAEEKIKTSAIKAMHAIGAIGIFAFEFFLTKEGKIYLNESAPRPHNSGHYSIEGCMTSQFHNHIRAVMNFPLGRADLRAKEVVMLNLLGTQNGKPSLSNIESFLKIPDGHLHLYGKKNSKLGRKMGHFTLLGHDKRQMFEILQKLKSEYSL